MSGSTTLRCTVSITDRLDADLTTSGGETLAVVGPNGAGKSTLLAAVAGSVGPARVRYGDEDWTQRPPQQRSVGLVHQDHRLFPHLSALENVAFGPRARGVHRREAWDRARHWLDRLGVGDLASRRPRQLSGGQAQRVAIARALATDPQVLLLDEPFAALDVAVAIDLRETLAAHLADWPGTVLLATHDALDIDALADRVLVLEGGRVAQHDDLASVGEAPATAHAARLLGRNVLRGTGDGTGTIALPGGAALVAVEAAQGPVLATFPPSAVTLAVVPPQGSARNAWQLQVRTVTRRDGVARVLLQAPPGVAASPSVDLHADVTAAAVSGLGLAPGTPVWASVKATEVRVFGIGESTTPR